MPVDLRQYDAAAEIDRVTKAFGVTPDRDSQMRKRRSVSFRTDRDTWVRIEHQTQARFTQRGNSGLEQSMVLDGVSRPIWYQGLSWVDRGHDRMWRADETEFITAKHVIPWGFLRVAPELPETWWQQLNQSLDALHQHDTSRVAARQTRITKTITAAFPDVETTVDEWVTAHGDFYWQNLTAPDFCILDWEDWGRAPRGWDAASLWHNSLLVPALADRIAKERHADLQSRSGQLCQLMRCVEILTAPPGYADDFVEPSRIHAQRLVDQLTSAV